MEVENGTPIENISTKLEKSKDEMKPVEV